jgi:Bacterial aa3 type cytochrome c oxidase subunit IV
VVSSGDKIAGPQRFDIVARATPSIDKEKRMSVDTKQGNPNMDYAAHEQSYNLFITLVKYGAGAVAVILIGMAIFLG